MCTMTVQASRKAPISVSVPIRPLLGSVFQTRPHPSFWSPAPAFVVPYTPMLVLTSVSECLVDHVLHGTFPNVMTFGELTMNDGFLDHKGMVSKVLRSKVCPPSLGTSVPTVRTRNWSTTIGFYPAKPCLTVLYHTPKCTMYVFVCLTSLPGVAAASCLHVCRTEGPSHLL